MPAPPPTTRAAVPLTVLTGFLGSGKTTVLQHLLSAPAAEGVAAVTNELSGAGVDGAALTAAAPTALTSEIAGGCVCCSLSARLEDELLRLADAGARHVVLETSGVTDPTALAAALRSPTLASRVWLSAVVAVVCAESFVDAARDSAAARRQLAAADVVVMNKCDLLPSPGSADVAERRLRELGAGAARVLRCVNGRVPPGELLAAAAPKLAFGKVGCAAACACGMCDESGAHVDADGLEATSFESTAPLRLADFVRAFVRGVPRALVRAKGWAAFEGLEGRTCVLEVSGRGRVRCEETAAREGEGGLLGARIVFIGRGARAEGGEGERLCGALREAAITTPNANGISELAAGMETLEKQLVSDKRFEVYRGAASTILVRLLGPEMHGVSTDEATASLVEEINAAEQAHSPRTFAILARGPGESGVPGDAARVIAGDEDDAASVAAAVVAAADAVLQRMFFDIYCCSKR